MIGSQTFRNIAIADMAIKNTFLFLQIIKN